MERAVAASMKLSAFRRSLAYVIPVTLSAMGIVLASCGAASAADYEVDRDASIFAVLTHRAGFAKALAHNHMVYPKAYDAAISGSPPRFPDPAFELAFQAKDLVVDDHGMQVRWFPRIEEAGILDEPFPDVSADDRSEIRSSMLGEKQLDAAAYPEITAALRALKPAVSDQAEEFTHTATIDLSLHGETVTRDIPVRITRGETALTVEGVGRFRFTNFGIKPFSAFFGAVKNQDVFHVYVNLTARAREPETSP